MNSRHPSPQPMSTGAAALAVTAAMLLAGCLNLAPQPPTPSLPVPATLTPLATEAGDIDLLSRPQALFRDPRLTAVIDLALANNRDLRISLLNVERTQALYRIERASQLPAIGASANHSSQQVPADLSATGSAVIARQYRVELGVAAWELDLFGRLRSLSEQALNIHLASALNAEAARLSLTAEVANTWIRLAADRRLLQLAQDSLLNRQASLQLVRGRHFGGIASALDLHQAEAALAAAEAALASAQTQVTQGQQALNLLVGVEVDAALLPSADAQWAVAIPALPAALDSQLLLRRPDIAAAEARLHAANANIGAARAAFFPRISLTGGYGSASADLAGLFANGSESWSFSPRLDIPIFTGGRAQAALKLAKLERDIAVAEYERSIRSAFSDVADALAVQTGLQPQHAAVLRQRDAARSSLQLSTARFERGLSSYLPVLDAQRTLLSAEQALITVEQLQQSNRVALFRALAGGWPSDAAAAADTGPPPSPGG